MEATFIVELSREVDDINASRSFGRKGAIRFPDALMVWSRGVCRKIAAGL
jgi:hypothetical protein